MYPLEPLPPNKPHEPTPDIQILNANTRESRCRGPKDKCNKIIADGELRLGFLKVIGRVENIEWRHLKCLTPGTFEHITKVHPKPDTIPGFSKLSLRNQQSTRKHYRELSDMAKQIKIAPFLRRSSRLKSR
ncbi:hypothetical protein FPV67DRAFT_1447409 [Lyophyllum atratum]|nr:hypothetical protein FPV67DRAFT_1447409 [Lyophyllum atratum]